MKRLMTMCLAVIMILSVSGAANAEVQSMPPAKWLQAPDLSYTGMDVLATNPKVLADDFLCTQTGFITDIHIWGSWRNDILPQNPNGGSDPGQVGFRLSIHSDIPKDDTVGYSQPGQLLWEKYFNPGEFGVNLYAGDLQEGWYNPNTGDYDPMGDTMCWQYNFFIDTNDAFKQEGTRTNPIVYWLDVEAFPLSVPGTAEPLFGWKTSLEHWNDDAVWGDSPLGPWNELRYPERHPLYGESIDLAFAITPEPATIALLGLGSLVLLRKRRA